MLDRKVVPCAIKIQIRARRYDVSFNSRLQNQESPLTVFSPIPRSIPFSKNLTKALVTGMRRDPPDEEGLTSYRRGRPFTLYLQGEGGRSCNPTHRCRNLSSPNDPKPRSFYRSIQLPDDGLLPPLHLLPLNSHPAGNLTLRPRTWGRTQHGFLARLGSSKTS